MYKRKGAKGAVTAACDVPLKLLRPDMCSGTEMIEMGYKIFTLSPGSTSTKLAVFEDEKMLFKANVRHDPETLAGFAHVPDQKDYRVATILDNLKENGIREFTISCHFCDLIDRLADFDKFGCRMNGVTEVKSSLTNLDGSVQMNNALRMEIL